MTISRRDVLRGMLGAAGAATLAACGISPEKRETETTSKPLGTPAGKLSIASWPLYIDIDEDTKKRPSIEAFEKATGIKVSYREVIDDNDPFFGTIRVPLSRGESTGWDVIVVTDWLAGRMDRLGYLETLEPERLPNVEEHIGEAFETTSAAYAVPWQAGITGIGYNIKQTKREITSFGDLFDPDFEGKVGMLSDMRDMIHLTLLWMAVDPAKATTAQVRAAVDKLVRQRKDGLVRGYFENDYIDALAKGDLTISLAYSGDIFQLHDPDIRFIVPEEGGILWSDEMAIPKGAEHPADAHAWMDFVYDPEIAADIAAYVQYISPVPEAQQVLRDRADEASGAEREDLLAVANSELIFPTAAMTERVHSYRVLTEDEEKTWNDLFAEVVES